MPDVCKATVTANAARFAEHLPALAGSSDMRGEPEPPFRAATPHRLLTVAEVASELRCSRAHVHHLIGGKVPHAPPPPSLRLGRRRLVLAESLREWIAVSEICYDPITPELIAVNARKA